MALSAVCSHAPALYMSVKNDISVVLSYQIYSNVLWQPQEINTDTFHEINEDTF